MRTSSLILYLELCMKTFGHSASPAEHMHIPVTTQCSLSWYFTADSEVEQQSNALKYSRISCRQFWTETHNLLPTRLPWWISCYGDLAGQKEGQFFDIERKALRSTSLTTPSVSLCTQDYSTSDPVTSTCWRSCVKVDVPVQTLSIYFILLYIRDVTRIDTYDTLWYNIYNNVYLFNYLSSTTGTVGSLCTKAAVFPEQMSLAYTYNCSCPSLHADRKRATTSTGKKYTWKTAASAAAITALPKLTCKKPVLFCFFTEFHGQVWAIPLLYKYQHHH